MLEAVLSNSSAIA